MCYIWGIPVLWSGCWLCTPTKSSFTRSCSGDGSFLKRTLEPRNLAAFSISAFNYRVTMNRIDKWHAEKRAKNHQFVKIKEIMWKQYSCGSMHSMHDLCFFQLENHTSKVKSREFSVQKINYGVTYHKSMVRGGRQKNNGFSGAQSQPCFLPQDKPVIPINSRQNTWDKSY